MACRSMSSEQPSVSAACLLDVLARRSTCAASFAVRAARLPILKDKANYIAPAVKLEQPDPARKHYRVGLAARGPETKNHVQLQDEGLERTWGLLLQGSTGLDVFAAFLLHLICKKV